MGFFHFLGNIARGDEQPGGGVFGFLNDVRKYGPASVAEAIPQTARQVRNVGVDVARGVAKIPETASRSYMEAVNDVIDVIPGASQRQENSFDATVNDPLRKALYGTDKLETYQTRGAGIQKATGIPAPLAALGLVGLDITPLGKGKSLVTQLAKTTVAKDAEKLLVKNGIDELTAKKIAPSIAGTQDTNVIKNLISGERPLPPAPSVAPPEITPPPMTPVGAEIRPVGQGTNPIQNVVDALRSGGIENLQQKQKSLYSTERTSRLGQTQNVGDLTGREATRAQLGALKGELPKVDATALVEHLKSKVPPEDVNGILDVLRTHPNLSGYEPITAQNTIVKLFDEGKLPRPSEWKILEKSLGPDFTDTLKTTAVDSMSNIQKIKNFGIQILGMPKAILASLDLSGGVRQGGVLGSRFPKIWGNAQKQSVKYFASEDAFQKGMGKIAASENKPIYDRMKLDLHTPGGLAHEEAYASTIAEKIPVGGRAIRASDRAYTGGLSELRAGAADSIIQDLKDSGIDINTFSDKELQKIGKFINTASGRGSGKAGGLFEKWAPALGDTLFSPRLWKSRLDMLNPIYYAKLGPTARKYALQSASSFASIAATVLGLAAAAGGVIETDARSSDFLKVRFGDTRYDILGGFQQNLVFAWRQLRGEKKSSLSGNVSSLTSGKFGSATRLSVLTDLIQNKENPAITPFTNILKGTDKAGNPINPVAEVGKLFVPLNIADTYKTIKHTGNIPEGLLKATIPGTVGIGVGTYGLSDVQPSKSQKAYLDKLQSRGASQGQIDASRSFFQTIKVGPDRTSYGEQIKKALGNNPTQAEIQKAVTLANEYNKRYKESFNDWRKKYSPYRTDKVLVDEYNSHLITDDTIARYLSSIEKENR